MIKVYRCHTGIIIVAKTVPDAIFLVDSHVTHLYGKKIFQYRLPYTPVIYVTGNSEDTGLGISVPYLIEAFFLDIRKIKPKIIVTKELSPFLPSQAADRFFPFLCNFIKDGIFKHCFPFVKLNDGDLGSLRVIAYLGNLNNRRIHPFGNNVWCNQPADCIFRGAGRDFAADHKPAVIVVHTSVIKL